MTLFVKWVCDKCGGTNIKWHVWYNPNTEEIDQGAQEMYDTAWCDTCQEEVRFHKTDPIPGVYELRKRPFNPQPKPEKGKKK